MPDRAVCAVSEDRQWLVVLEPEPREWGMCFTRYEWDPHSRGFIPAEYDIEDTGQSAHEVLARWLNEQELEEVERQEREYPGFA